VLYVHQRQLFFGFDQLALQLSVRQLRLVQGRLQGLEVRCKVAIFGLQPIIGSEEGPKNVKKI